MQSAYSQLLLFQVDFGSVEGLSFPK